MDTGSPNGKRGSANQPVDPRAAAQVITIRADVLARHGARVLDPSTAVRDENGVRPQATVYRADTLLAPARLLPMLLPGGGQHESDFDKALAPLGVRLAATRSQPGREHPHVNLNRAVPVPLVAREDAVGDAAPNPWAALVALRRFFRDNPEQAQDFALDHLLWAASLDTQGAPFTGGGSVGGDQGPAAGLTLFTGSRNPVWVAGGPPVRKPAGGLASGRRPVVAVLDTGIGYHDWLPVGDRITDPSVVTNPDVVVRDMSTDPIVEVSHEFQAELAQHELEVATANGTTVAALRLPWEERDLVQPLLGLTDSHAGHGTFVTGLVHQTCPEARILMLRMLHSDGFSTEGSFLVALDWLRRRQAAALNNGDTDLLIDVVSLSLGFYSEDATPTQVGKVKDAIDELTNLGIVVIAAAGNDSTTRPFLPAAFGDSNRLLAAIGARNASGITTAAFSNYGTWISRWAPGNALVSTVPKWQGARGPSIVTPDGGVGPRWRTAPDDDDLTSGFAVWAGTSFATPVVAGYVATALANDEYASKADVTARAARALRTADARLADKGWQEPSAG
jgi:subtilase family protein